MVSFEDLHGARRPAVGQGVDEHQRVASVEKVVGEVHAPDPVVDDADPGICDAFRNMADHLGAEPVVAEEDVADAGYENFRRDGTSPFPTCAGSSGNG